MSKKLIIKLIIVLVVAALVYSIFWFFKVSQIEKQISKFINQNNAYISVGEISVSGFPINQNITIKNLKFTVPNPALAGNQIIVKHLEAKAGILDTEFLLTLERDVSLRTLEGRVAVVEFAKSPKISAAIVEGMVSNMKYQDEGYKIHDNEHVLIYAAASSAFTANILIGDDEKIITKITADIKDVEGFDIIDMYNNAFEKGIIDGIKTGEIVLGNLPMDNKLNDVADVTGALDAKKALDLAPVAVTDVLADQSLQGGVAQVSEENLGAKLSEGAQEVTPKVISAVNLPAVDVEEQIVAGTDDSPVLVKPIILGQETIDQEASLEDLGKNLGENLGKAKIVEKVVEAKPIKNNFIVNIEYILSPNKSSQDLEVPFDPTQIQDIPVQYSKSIRINNLEISNADYTIMVDGDINSLPDDGLPSGNLSLKIKQIDKLTNYLAHSFVDIARGKDIDPDEVQAVNLMESEIEEDNSYNDFLIKLSQGINAVAKELSEKSGSTKGDIAHFHIKREKNLDFLVNESSVREILGKF